MTSTMNLILREKWLLLPNTHSAVRISKGHIFCRGIPWFLPYETLTLKSSAPPGRWFIFNRALLWCVHLTFQWVFQAASVPYTMLRGCVIILRAYCYSYASLYVLANLWLDASPQLDLLGKIVLYDLVGH